MKENILAKVLDNADVGLYVSDLYTCEILFANQKFASLAGCMEEELIGRKCWSLINNGEEGRCSFCPHEKLVDDEGNPTGKYEWELYLPFADIWVKSINEAIPWMDGRLANIVTFVDITGAKAAQERLADLAFVDQSLQLKNGLKMEQYIQESEQKPSLVIFDILSLHKINEVYGRDIGDILLISVRDWIRSLDIPDSDLYRIGGDEFAILVRQATPDSLKAIADKIYLRFTEPWIIEKNGNKFDLFCNASIAVIPVEFLKESDSLLNLVERTLKVAKVGARIAVYDKKMDREFKKRLQLELSLKKSIQKGMEGFDVYYQPIADPVTGMWCGLEALCRWNSPELGVISPLVFIAEAERLELIETIGLWVLETAISKCKEWKLDKRKRFLLDVNLSAAQFLDEMLAPKIIKLLNSYDYPGEKFSIEITESTQFTFTDQSLETIKLLRENDILVALDDFGTGYSNFNNLKSLPVDVLKIERDFISGIENDSYQQYLLHMMSELARAADMKLIAEGVENEEQLAILLENGADLLQGYLFSKPLPPDQMEGQLSRFYQIDESFGIIRNRRIDVKKLLDTENSYLLAPNMYKLLNECMHILFYNPNTDEAIVQVLKAMALHLDVSRAYIYSQAPDLLKAIYNEGNIYSNTSNWCMGGLTQQKELPASLTPPGSWIAALEKDRIILASDISLLPDDTYVMLAAQGTKAIVALPLWDENRLLGFVGFDECRYSRLWRSEEILLLYNLCLVISGVINKGREENRE